MKTTLKKPVAIVGYSGHAYVIIDIFLNAGRLVTAYCDSEEKALNPYHLTYLGKESEVINKLKKFDYFACVGHNGIREKIHTQLSQYLGRSYQCHTSQRRYFCFCKNGRWCNDRRQCYTQSNGGNW